MAKNDSTEGVRNLIGAVKGAEKVIGYKMPATLKVLEQHRANLEQQDREYNAMLAKLPKK